jgi:hypothetical protein
VLRGEQPRTDRSRGGEVHSGVVDLPAGRGLLRHRLRDLTAAHPSCRLDRADDVHEGNQRRSRRLGDPREVRAGEQHLVALPAGHAALRSR